MSVFGPQPGVRPVVGTRLDGDEDSLAKNAWAFFDRVKGDGTLHIVWEAANQSMVCTVGGEGYAYRSAPGASAPGHIAVLHRQSPSPTAVSPSGAPRSVVLKRGETVGSEAAILKALAPRQPTCMVAGFSATADKKANAGRGRSHVENIIVMEYVQPLAECAAQLTHSTAMQLLTTLVGGLMDVGPHMVYTNVKVEHVGVVREGSAVTGVRLMDYSSLSGNANIRHTHQLIDGAADDVAKNSENAVCISCWGVLCTLLDIFGNPRKSAAVCDADFDVVKAGLSEFLGDERVPPAVREVFGSGGLGMPPLEDNTATEHRGMKEWQRAIDYEALKASFETALRKLDNEEPAESFTSGESVISLPARPSPSNSKNSAGSSRKTRK